MTLKLKLNYLSHFKLHLLVVAIYLMQKLLNIPFLGKADDRKL